jgi:hypothetical protein
MHIDNANYLTLFSPEHLVDTWHDSPSRREPLVVWEHCRPMARYHRRFQSTLHVSVNLIGKWESLRAILRSLNC